MDIILITLFIFITLLFVFISLRIISWLKTITYLVRKIHENINIVSDKIDNELLRNNAAIEAAINDLKCDYQKYFQLKTEEDLIKTKEKTIKKETKMNIVLPLGPENRNNDIELKYALRCLPKHDKLYIIGRNPNLNNIIHIPFDDKPGIENAAENIYRKLLLAFEYVDNFWCWADDYYVMSGFDYNTYYCDGSIEDKIIPQTSESYKRTLKNTLSFLQLLDKPTRFFNLHCPFYYEKDKFPVIDDWPKYGYAIKSVYANLNYLSATIYPDMKIKKFLPTSELTRLVKNRKFFSSHDSYINRSFLDVLSSLWPLASCYETSSHLPV